MKTPLRILVIEDSEDDAFLILHQIKKANYDIQYDRVETPEGMKAALENKTWDIILSDYVMPRFNGLEALGVLQESELDIPFIIISGTIGEDVAVEAMKAGANDYIMKNNLQRLLPAIERELRESKSRREKKRLELRQQKAEQEREQLLTTLSAKNEEMESILYASSHDLKSPLVNIQSFSGELERNCRQIFELGQKYEFLKNDKQFNALIQNEIPEALHYICANTSKVFALLNSLMKVSRASMTNVHPENLDMNQLIKEVCSLLASRIRQQQAEVSIDRLPCCYGDKTQLNQVFTNLIINALNYLSPERQGMISITGYTEQKMSIYCVKDNGIGIRPHYHKKVFELFHRLNPNDGVAGDGVGLTIVNRIVQSHNGKIWIESEEGQGSRFYIALPEETMEV